MIGLDKVRGYHEQALESVRDKSEHALADLVFLKVVYEGRPECYTPSISEMFYSYIGQDLESGFKQAEKIARTLGGPITILYEPELKMLKLWTPEMERRAKDIRSRDIRELYMGSPNHNAFSAKDPPELYPEYVPMIKALLREVANYRKN